MTLAEPFTQRAVLQEMLDTLREKYEGLYVTKLKPITQKRLEIVPVIEPIEIEEVNSRVLEIDLKTIDLDKLEELNQKTTMLDKSVADEEEIVLDKPIVKEIQEKSIFDYIWPLLFFITFAFLLLLLKSRQTYKKEMINSEKLEQTIIEMKTKEKFLAHASHELRTPMTAILGLTYLVLEKELSKSQKDYVQRIESSAKHLLNIVNDILDISKLQALELKIEKVEFNINDIFISFYTTKT